MSIEAPEDLRAAQRRGRIVIVTIIVLFLLACAALGLLLWQREIQESRLDELRAPGLQTVAVPPLPEQLDEVRALENNRGLIATYVDSDGEPVPQLRLLNIRAGADPDLCELLGTHEPDLADQCTAVGDELSARTDGPDATLLGEGALRGSTLVILVGDPADYTSEQLRVLVDTAEQMSVRDLAARAG